MAWGRCAVAKCVHQGKKIEIPTLCRSLLNCEAETVYFGGLSNAKVSIRKIR